MRASYWVYARILVQCALALDSFRHGEVLLGHFLLLVFSL